MIGWLLALDMKYVTAICKGQLQNTYSFSVLSVYPKATQTCTTVFYLYYQSRCLCWYHKLISYNLVFREYASIFMHVIFILVMFYGGNPNKPNTNLSAVPEQGAVSIRKTVLPGMAIPMLKIRRPNGRLIFNMENAIRR